NEVVQLVGEDVLPNDQALVLEIARIIKKGFLQQNALHKIDTYVVLEKQYKMLQVIDTLYESALKCVKMGIPISIIKSQDVVQDVLKMKYEVPNDNTGILDDLRVKIVGIYDRLSQTYE
ncbi:MAG: V-type ATP synthase subunit A, partial [Clostridiales bacterium]|nr:V-type ATP synthase subunit A [Clostridiales bacterium]